MYLLKYFSLFRTKVSDSSAHVFDQRMQDNSGFLQGRCKRHAVRRGRKRGLCHWQEGYCYLPDAHWQLQDPLICAVRCLLLRKKKKVNTPDAQERRDLIQSAPAAKDRKMIGGSLGARNGNCALKPRLFHQTSNTFSPSPLNTILASLNVIINYKSIVFDDSKL